MAGKITFEEIDSSVKVLIDSKINTSSIKNDLTTGGASNVLSAEQGKALKALIDSLTSKVNGKADTSTVTSQLDGKINKSDIVDSLVGGTGKVLSADQGKALKGLIDSLTTKVNNKADTATVNSQLGGKINTSAIKNDLTSGGASNVLSAEQGVAIKALIDNLTERIDAVEGGVPGDVSELIASKVPKSDIVNDLTTGGATKVLSAEQGKTLKGLVDGKASKSDLNSKINTSAIKNDLTTGGASNVLSAEQGVTLKGLIDSLTSKVNGKADSSTVTSQLAGKVNTADIINDLTTGGTGKVLSAQQGVVLKGLVDGKADTATVNSKINTSAIKNDLTTGGASNVLSAEQGVTLKGLVDGVSTKLDGKADKIPVSTTVDGLMSAKDKVKLDTIAYGANSYAHPPTHPPSVIAQDATHRFMTDAERKLIQAWEEFKTNGGQIGSVITFPKGVTRQISQNLTLREKDYLQRMGLSNYNGYPCWSAIIEDPDNDENSNGLLFMLGSGVEGDPYKDNYVRPLKMGYAQKNNIGSVNVPWDDIYLRGVSKQANGYTKLPNGLIMQWGGKDLKISGGGGNSYISTSLPISFSSMILCCGATIDYNITENSGAWIEYINLNVRPNGKVGLHFNAANIHKMWTGDKTFRIMWFAVGY